jgi:DNA-binding response OmpR family regulator
MARVRLLVVDDVQDQRDALKRLLEMEGFDVATAGDGSQAVKAQRARPVEILITDIFMPGQEGIETIALFRREWPGVKIIAMSGGGEVAQREYLGVAQALGAHRTLKKPFAIGALLGAIASLRKDPDVTQA